MKSRPIIFSGPMVRAIIDGRKTQTRRVVKPQPGWIASSSRWGWPIPKSKVHPGCCTAVFSASREWWEYVAFDQMPYQPGNLLWVRETWDCAEWENIDGGYGFRRETIRYRADDSHSGTGWRPSIHMPRWASRLTLLITDVRVERVQDISPYSITYEGLHSDEQNPIFRAADLRIQWIDLWDSINAKRGYSWESNPWVWVVEFEVIRSNIDDVIRDVYGR